MPITYKNQELYVDDVPLSHIAQQFGTPCYVYSKLSIVNNWQALAGPLKQSQHEHKIFYAVKANSNLAILKLLAGLGAGFDTVSAGEIARVIKAGGESAQIVFSGVGKTSAEISYALDVGIHAFHIESVAELQRIQQIAQQKNKIAAIALRINPDVTANSHPYISTGSKNNKFGIDYAKAIETFKLAADLSHIKIKGIACHIGSQITTMEPFLQAAEQLQAIIKQLNDSGIKLEYIDVGGGLGIRYKDETPPTAAEYVQAIMQQLASSNLAVHFEPGRFLVANAGVLLTKVEYLKTTGENNFAIVDAAMNDLMRPALYESYHAIQTVNEKPTASAQNYAVVGPVCESGDFLGNNRVLNITAGDLLAIKDTGAYGFSMSSNYNSRPRVAEVLIDGTSTQLIRARETVEDLWRGEDASRNI